MKTYLVANWKANKTTTEVLAWTQAVSAGLPPLSSNLEVIICAPLVHIEMVRQQLPTTALGAQNLSPYPDGAYTGEVTSRMLKNLVSYVLVGHSERRHYFHETNTDVALKVTQALEQDITPIVAITADSWRQQLHSLKKAELDQIIIMYEPPEAISRQVGPIGTGEAAPLEEVIATINDIKASITAPVLYGGSIKSHNIREFLQAKIIDGVVPGSASLDAGEWLRMITLSQEIRG